MNFNFRGHMDHIIDIGVPQRGQKLLRSYMEYAHGILQINYPFLLNQGPQALVARVGC